MNRNMPQRGSAANDVAQVSSLLYRRFPTRLGEASGATWVGTRSEWSSTPVLSTVRRLEALRYSRLEICATAEPKNLPGRGRSRDDGSLRGTPLPTEAGVPIGTPASVGSMLPDRLPSSRDCDLPGLGTLSRAVAQTFQTIALVSLLLAALLSARAADAPIVLDSRKQLFLDDYLIASMTRVKRTVEQARKFPGNPVLWATERWEPSKAVVYGSVIRDGAKFKMWYQSGLGVGYAESDDGIQWSKPPLDLTLVAGERSNILFSRKSQTEGAEAFPYFQELFGVYRDDREPDSSRRYKMGFLDIDWKYNGPDRVPWHKGQRRGLGVAGSPDGIHWKLIDSWATTAISDGATHWMFDPARGKYLLYGRTLKARPEVVAAWQTNDWFKEWFSGRAVARLESPDFLKWDFTRPDTAPVVMMADLQDKPGTEIYSMNVFPYEGIYIGLVQVFHATPEDPTLNVQLAVSRDSIHFTRVGDRSPFLPLGPIGSWDRFNLSLANNEPVVAGDELRFYYGGRLYRHSPYAGPDKGPEKSGIGFASIQRDRFVALEASFDGGEIVTKLVTLKGATLHLNAKSDFGEIIVELLDANARPLARSEPIQRDGLDIPVKWSEGFEPPGGPVALRIQLKNARVFALWCGP